MQPLTANEPSILYLKLRAYLVADVGCCPSSIIVQETMNLCTNNKNQQRPQYKSFHKNTRKKAQAHYYFFMSITMHV